MPEHRVIAGAQLPFESQHQFAERGLPDTQLLGRTPEVQLRGHRDESPKLPKLPVSDPREPAVERGAGVRRRR